MARPEMGPMKFNGDWCGYFIRGDNAYALGLALDSVLALAEIGRKFATHEERLTNTFALAQLRSFREDLRWSDEALGSQDIQVLKEFKECQP